MNRKQYMITLQPDADADSVAAELQSQGLQVDQVMREIGVISASNDGADVKSVRSLRGVSAVEESRGIQIPPPDAPVQ